MKELKRRLDPLAGMLECPWCASPPSPCQTCFECVHEVIAHALREEDDQAVKELSVGGEQARVWHKRMSEGPDRFLSAFTVGDVVSVAGLTRALRSEAAAKATRGETVVSVTAVAVGLLVVFLLLNLAWRVA